MSSTSSSDYELDSLPSPSAMAADAPLLSAAASSSPSFQQPAWMRPSQASRPRRLLRSIYVHARPFLARLLALLRPLRPRSWKSMLFAAACVVSVLLACSLPSSPLPRYTGPHAVGTIDLEVPLDTPRRVSDTVFRADGRPAFELETVLFTLYYPAAAVAAAAASQGQRPAAAAAATRHHHWIPKPIGLTARGYARFAHMDNFVMRPLLTFVLWLLAGGITIPAEVDAPLLPPSSSALSSLSAAAGVAPSFKKPQESRGGGGDGEAEAEQDEKTGAARLPVMVFSHGMASSRTDYTAYLGELASRGYVVAAVEHRDGSCPGTTIMTRAKQARQEREQQQPQQQEEDQQEEVVPVQRRELLHFNEHDLVPSNTSSTSVMTTPQLKIEQLAFRTAEIFETVAVLRAIDAGRGRAIARSSSRDEGLAALPTFARRLDLTHNLLIGGHSYGATGALQALKPHDDGDDHRQQPFPLEAAEAAEAATAKAKAREAAAAAATAATSDTAALEAATATLETAATEAAAEAATAKAKAREAAATGAATGAATEAAGAVAEAAAAKAKAREATAATGAATGAVSPRGGICLDPGKASGPLNAHISVPLLVVHSASWSRQQHSLFFGRPHFDAVRDLVAGVLERTRAAWFVTALGTSHPSVTDAPLLQPRLLSWTTGANLNTTEALQEYVRVSHDFFRFLSTGAAPGILAEEVTHKKYGEWVSPAKQASTPNELARLWQIHVSPAASADTQKESSNG
ncbi:Platelet-activating factor acetylhydrolase, plasma/intracellular isoform II [Moelleriella libera RCEF 2490]|uniref:1-alkyl-2-acetylglycerophosphocholine esterase n=1 Tax=Moelleriella libera RCEF 2490 TaxID=1081109 RepID=A0A166USX7_9HYPO|nr:Platelet-activating factor acetylhydrolase, plasma/intracellular isoform II [Moelleriella libera RCEF 2490]